MIDRYIPNPHDGIYRPRPPMQGEREAEANGNPYPVNTPAWHVWNDGYQANASDYGLSVDVGDIIKDGGKRARQALTPVE